MDNRILESISNITHEQYEAMRKASNCIILYESKIDCIDSYKNNDKNQFIFKDGHIFDMDGDELFVITIGLKQPETPTDNSQYDFINHDLNVGTANLAIANILREIFDYSKIYHHGKPSSEGLLYSGSMFGSNLAKYQKTLDLMNHLETSNQNFCKLYYATDNVGTFKGHRAYVFFAEMNLPDGEFYFAWHLMRDGVKSKNVGKVTPKNKICNNINDFIPSGTKVIKYGKSKINDYNQMETKYDELFQQHINGAVVLDKLVNAFNLPT